MQGQSISVQVQSDYLDRLSRCSPTTAIAELIWNALDADATEVTIEFARNSLGGLEQIIVRDNGHGLSVEKASSVFGNLGGSWKRHVKTTPSNRQMHGQNGEGRFRAFALGEQVRWTSVVLHDETFEGVSISGRRRSNNFLLERLSNVNTSGTTVTISQTDRACESLLKDHAIQRITQEFALYLRHYSDVVIAIDGIVINPKRIESRSEVFELDEVVIEGAIPFKPELTVIEWKVNMPRFLVLCDEGGFPLAEMPPGIQAPGFSFTAYLSSSYIRDASADNRLALGHFDPNLSTIVDNSKRVLRDYFRQRTASRAAEAIASWQREKVYPFSGVPSSPVEAVERQVFDICALSMSDYLPDFEKTAKKQKKLAFRLLREALERNSTALQSIFIEVLELPPEKQDELASLLKHTKLSAILRATKLVADRLEFLAGLEQIVFDPIHKKTCKERSQLHRLLAQNTWIFGEEFSLAADDESLNTVLKRHLKLLEREDLTGEPVLREDDQEGIVDLMLSKVIPQPNPIRREHVIIELKRPSVNVNSEVLGQIESYAFAVAEDDRFIDTGTKWTFIAVANDMTRDVRRRVNQKNRPSGLAYEAEDLLTYVWVFSWSQIIEQARARLNFFREALEYNATQESSRENLNRIYQNYIPSSFVIPPALGSVELALEDGA